MVHEGDRRQMAEAIAESARQRQGYGTIRTPPLSAQAQVYLLPPPQWDQQDFNRLEPYGGPPDYPEWAGQVYNRPAQPTAECSATLRPMMREPASQAAIGLRTRLPKSEHPPGNNPARSKAPAGSAGRGFLSAAGGGKTASPAAGG